MSDYVTILEEKEVLDAAQVTQARERLAAGEQEIEVITSFGITKEALKQALADYYGVPVGSFNAETDTIEQSVLQYIPEESARHYKMMPLRMEGDVMEVGILDPDNLAAKEALNFISVRKHIPYKFYLLLPDELEAALMMYENLTGEVDEALTSIEVELTDVEDEADNVTEADRDHIKEDAPVTKIVATILRYAVDGAASDIHIEPTPEKVRVRFRVDGVLATSLELPKDVQFAVVARVKILASLRLDEKRKPQDGRFTARIDGRKIDFRVSILPTSHGEKAVMRILDTESGVRGLEETGISSYAMEAIKRAVNLPYGIILISGPTGSGKSTTLYAMLGEVDRAGKNVLSLEDPVEYDISGVSQSQVRPEIGYSFAHGLRAALRQDPDIIMVGEIRDKETAQLAIQAALTGHLVLSTIHTNNSIGVIPRLIDMGVDPYLIAPTLKLAIAQRLARRLCPDTGKPESVTGGLELMIENEFATLPQQYHSRLPKLESVMHPEPSPGCASGTKGRIAVMETLEINSAIEKLILSGGSEDDIYEAARANGYMSMKEDAIIKALEHKIPYEEVNKFSTSILADEQKIEDEEDAVSDNNVLIDVTEDSIIKTVDNPAQDLNKNV